MFVKALVEEDDRPLLARRVLEDPAEYLLAFAVPLAEHLRPAYLVEPRARAVGDDPRQHRLARAGRSGKEDALDRTGADLGQLFLAFEADFDELAGAVDDAP